VRVLPGSSAPLALRVRVDDAVAHLPVSGARVLRWREDRDQSELAVTGLDGAAILPNECSVSRFAVSAPGYCTEFREDDGTNEEMRFYLVKGRVLSGRVLSATSGTAVEGATVYSWRVEAGLGGLREADLPQVTRMDGRFEIAAPSTGETMKLLVAKMGYEHVVTQVREDTPEFEVRLGGGGSVCGRVTDEQGRPARGIDVFLLRPGDRVPGRLESRTRPLVSPLAIRSLTHVAITNDQGCYEVTGIPVSADGMVRRVIAARCQDGRESRSSEFALLQRGDIVTRDVSFGALGRVTVELERVTTLGSAQVRVSAQGSMLEAVQDAAPLVSFDGLSPGPYNVTLTRNDCAGEPVYSTTAIVTADSVTRVSFAPRDEILAGLVLDSAGAPVAGAVIRYYSEDKESRLSVAGHSATNVAGRFVLGGLRRMAGDLYVSVARASADTEHSLEALQTAALMSDVVPGSADVVVRLRDTQVIGRFTVLPTRPVRVHWTTGSRTGSARLVWDDEGRFSFQPTATDRSLCLWLVTEESAPMPFDRATMPAHGELDLGEIAFSEGITARGRIVTENGAAVTGAELVCSDPWLASEIRVKADGTFTVERVPIRPLSLSARISERTWWHMLADPRYPIHFTIGPWSSVSGLVVGSGGAGIHRARVTFRWSAPDGMTRSPLAVVLTDAEGRFSMQLQSGAWRIRAEAEGRESQQVAMDVGVAEAASVTLRLSDM
jgi:protocatechuate 3,4-dioxygenase beta subunit